MQKIKKIGDVWFRFGIFSFHFESNWVFSEII